ncbi:MAG TPA: translation initiation factor IF-2, partial [Puia sp.]
MAETTTPRLMAAAKEFNIGRDTLIDFLAGKGFSKDELKPTAKLTEDMYRSLQQEFQGDKVAKIKSNQIDLPKGSVEAKRKKEDEAVLFRKETRKPLKEETAAPVEEPRAPTVETPKKPKAEEPKKEPEIIKIEAPDIEGPKVIDKIDLSAIDSSTRPKKTTRKKPTEEPAKEEPRPEEQKAAETPVAGETETD